MAKNNMKAATRVIKKMLMRTSFVVGCLIALAETTVTETVMGKDTKNITGVRPSPSTLAVDPCLQGAVILILPKVEVVSTKNDSDDVSIANIKRVVKNIVGLSFQDNIIYRSIFFHMGQKKFADPIKLYYWQFR